MTSQSAPFLKLSILLGAALIAGCGSHAGKPPLEAAAQPRASVRAWSCAPLGPERCFDARDNNCNGLVDEGCGVASGLIHFALAWDDDSADVDLEVLDPTGDIADVGTVSASGLTKDRDCPGRDESCRQANTENVILIEDRGLERGEYRVRVRLDAVGTRHDEVHVSLSARVGPKTDAREFVLSAEERQRAFVWTL